MGPNINLMYRNTSLERLEFAIQMVLTNKNEVCEIIAANIWATNDA